jgi:hypothetical protein
MAVHEALKDAEKCIEIEPTFSKWFCKWHLMHIPLVCLFTLCFTT